jgi:hypothetical protein
VNPNLTHLLLAPVFTAYFYNFEFNTVFPSTFRSLEWSLSLRVFNQNHVFCFPPICYLSRPIIHINNWWQPQSVKLLILSPTSSFCKFSQRFKYSHQHFVCGYSFGWQTHEAIGTTINLHFNLDAKNGLQKLNKQYKSNVRSFQFDTDNKIKAQ